MNDPELNLLASFILVPIAIGLHIWVRKRRESRLNESGQVEFGSLGSTLISTIAEGVAIITSLILMIMVMGSILKYFFPQIFGTQL